MGVSTNEGQTAFTRISRILKDNLLFMKARILFRRFSVAANLLNLIERSGNEVFEGVNTLLQRTYWQCKELQRAMVTIQQNLLK